MPQQLTTMDKPSMLNDFICDKLELIFGSPVPDAIYIPVAVIVAALLVTITYFLCWKVIAVIINRITVATTTDWDDDLLTPRVLKALSVIPPAFLLKVLLPDIFPDESTMETVLEKLCDLFIVWSFVHLVNSFLRALHEALDKRQKLTTGTINGFFQILRLIFILIGILVGFSILFDKSITLIVTALGAWTAVVMLVFQDVILGLVAGIQLTANNMLKKGDWIIVPKAGANGEVEEVHLTTVKVRNWDNSITSLPPYTLVRESFQNYNKMRSERARRVSRYIYIDFNSITVDPSTGEVNLTRFRHDMEQYLINHPNVLEKKLLMVRQLQPTPQGLPLELYFFLDTPAWKQFEVLQSDIFDWVYAQVPLYGLRIYQAPAGTDFNQTTAPAVI